MTFTQNSFFRKSNESNLSYTNTIENDLMNKSISDNDIKHNKGDMNITQQIQKIEIQDFPNENTQKKMENLLLRTKDYFLTRKSL